MATPAVPSLGYAPLPHGSITYELGAPIALADFLALPPDGNRYARDEKGRLILAPPDDKDFHRTPLSALMMALASQIDPSQYLAVQEGGIAFDPIYHLSGNILPRSHHGPRTLDPDIACFRRPIRTVKSPDRESTPAYAAQGLGLVVEFLSVSTWRADLGHGQADKVDHWRTYLENRVPEYWIINASNRTLGLPPRSCLALSLDPSNRTWVELRAEDGRFASETYRDRTPLLAGLVRSLALPGVVLDLDKLWRDASP